MKSPRRAGVAGGVGDGEGVPLGGVQDGDATFLSADADLNEKKMLEWLPSRINI